MVKVCQIDIFLVIVGHFLYTLNMKNKAIGGHYVPLINSYGIVYFKEKDVT